MGSDTDTNDVSLNAKNIFSLAQRTIIVTGATGGLGFSITEALLQTGADVIAIDQSKSPSNLSWDTLSQTAQQAGSTLTYHGCDITDFDVTSSVFEKAVAESRFPLRGVVHCAGIGWIGSSIDFPVSEARKIIDVNLVGTLVVAQAAARIIQKHDVPASIVFIASMSGYVVNKGTPNAAYTASKAGVHQLTRNLASEWGRPDTGPSIRVNSISPGVIRTPMTAGVLANATNEKVWTEETMLKRLSEPGDYCGPVMFLLSDASSYVTGADLLVDGGYTAW